MQLNSWTIGLFFLHLVCSSSLAAPATGTPILRAALIEFAPTAWVGVDGKAQGSYIDLLSAIEKRTGLQFEAQTFPFLRAADRVRAGLADLTIGQLTPATSKIVGKKIKIYKYRYFLLTQKSKPVCSMPEVRGVIGRLRGGCADLLPSQSVQFFDITGSYEQGITMLEKGRLNGFCGIEEGLAFSIRLMKLDSEIFSKFLIGESERYLHFSSNFSDVHFKKIQKAIEELYREGELKKIQVKYLDESAHWMRPECKSLRSK